MKSEPSASKSAVTMLQMYKKILHGALPRTPPRGLPPQTQPGGRAVGVAVGLLSDCRALSGSVGLLSEVSMSACRTGALHLTVLHEYS